jgi:hypothetical protein
MGLKSTDPFVQVPFNCNLSSRSKRKCVEGMKEKYAPVMRKEVSKQG